MPMGGEDPAKKCNDVDQEGSGVGSKKGFLVRDQVGLGRWGLNIALVTDRCQSPERCVEPDGWGSMAGFKNFIQVGMSNSTPRAVMCNFFKLLFDALRSDFASENAKSNQLKNAVIFHNGQHCSGVRTMKHKRVGVLTNRSLQVTV